MYPIILSRYQELEKQIQDIQKQLSTMPEVICVVLITLIPQMVSGKKSYIYIYSQKSYHNIRNL